MAETLPSSTFCLVAGDSEIHIDDENLTAQPRGTVKNATALQNASFKGLPELFCGVAGGLVSRHEFGQRQLLEGC